MSKDKVMRIFVIITSVLAGVSYFFKYLDGILTELGNWGGAILDSYIGISTPSFNSLPSVLFAAGPVGIGVAIGICFVPILFLLLTAIFNIITLANGKLQKTSSVFAIISSIEVFLSAVSIKIVLMLTPGMGTGFMWWVQITCAIACLVLGSILCHWIRKGRIAQGGAPLSPKDVALVGLQGGAGGQVFVLDNDEKVSVGRDPQQCNIIVPGSSANVSRKHCVVHYDFDRSAYMVMDTSSNGTFVYENGQKKRLPLGVEVPVLAGNVIMLGDELTTFRLN